MNPDRRIVGSSDRRIVGSSLASLFFDPLSCDWGQLLGLRIDSTLFGTP